MRSAILLPLLVAIGSSAFVRSARAGEDEPAAAVAVQAGWWSLDGEWRGRSGVFAGAGVPWVAAAITTNAQWMVPYAARAGYQHDLSPRWKLRGAAHLAGTYGRENPCGDCGHIVTRTFAFLELGLRYEARSGFVAGLDLPLFGVGKTGRADIYPPPLSFAFAQGYLGYSWRL
jgi:hypothetical protein